MENTVIIQSVRDATRLTFSDVNAEGFTATLESSHFFGRRSVSTYLNGPPLPLFDGMARAWRGWNGYKTWAALEDELRLTAKSDRMGHIELVIEMRNFEVAADWRLVATLHLEAGQLDELARAVEALFGEIQPR